MSTSPKTQLSLEPIPVDGRSPISTDASTIAPPEPAPGPPPPLLPAATAEPEATPGPLPLTGRGHHVASVEIVGQFVTQSGPLHGLHLEEIIRYSDGRPPDIVGYDPEGKGGLLHEGSRLFAETSIDKTPEQYIADAEKLSFGD